MRAIGVMEFGGPEKLQVVDIPEPHPGPGEVRIRVHAAAVNPTDTALRAGLRRLRAAAPHSGMDAAGVVSEVGGRVPAGRGPGDGRGDAGAAGWGAYADHIVVPAESVVRMPEGADFFAASTLLMNALTARLALDRLALEPGQTVAVTGAAGAFGGYAVQLAKADGLRVVADASEADEDLRGLGRTWWCAVVTSPTVSAPPARRWTARRRALLHDLVVPAVRDNGRMAVVRAWDGRPGRGIEVHRILVTEALKDTVALTGCAGRPRRGATLGCAGASGRAGRRGAPVAGGGRRARPSGPRLQFRHRGAPSALVRAAAWFRPEAVGAPDTYHRGVTTSLVHTPVFLCAPGRRPSVECGQVGRGCARRNRQADAPGLAIRPWAGRGEVLDPSVLPGGREPRCVQWEQRRQERRDSTPVHAYKSTS